MAKLTIDGVTAELVFDMASWEAMEEQVCLLSEFDEKLKGRGRLKTLREITAIFAAEGARLGKGEKMPAEWIREHMKPAEVGKVNAAVDLAIADGLRMETKKGEDAVVDPILEELEKKEGKDA